ncbi:MAG TPA: universal stress protein [Longimicrobiales bacterium]|nr:universal stress protein [Longimicrobiales bacterium]
MEKPAGPSTERRDPQAVRYRRVMVPLDGTEVAESALRPAAALAARAGASLHLVCVVEGTPDEVRAVSMQPMTPEGVGPGPQRARDRAMLLEDAARRVRDEWGCATAWELIADASPARALVAHAKELGADLVAAVSRTRGWIARGLLGSTARELVRAEAFPVLLIPAEDADGPPEAGPMQGPVETVAVALGPEMDLHDLVLAHALAWADLWDARIALGQVVVTVPVPAAGAEGTVPVALPPNLLLEPMSFEAAQRQLESVSAALSERRSRVEAHLLEGPDVADTLLEFVDSTDADILIVGRHHRNLWERLFGASESDRIARRIRSAGLLVCHERSA